MQFLNNYYNKKIPLKLLNKNRKVNFYSKIKKWIPYLWHVVYLGEENLKNALKFVLLC